MTLPIFHNYKIKLVAFIVAIFIWFVVVTENDYESVIDVPILPVNLASDKVILNNLPASAKVKIKGTGKDLIALGVGRSGRIELDLSNAKDTKTFVLTPQTVLLSRVSEGIQSTEVLMPDSVVVVLDSFYGKKVPITPKVTVKVAPGFTTVGKLQLKPDSVLISGPRGLVTTIAEIPTIDKAFTDLTFDLDENLPLKKPSVDKVGLSGRQTHIFQDVQQLIELSVTGIPVEVRHAPSNLAVYVVPSTMSLVLEGGGDLLASLNRHDIAAYIDYDRVKNAPGQAHTAVIEPPPGITPRDAQPKTFKLVFEKK